MNEYEGLTLEELTLLLKKHQAIIKKIQYAINKAKKEKIVDKL